jgi:methyltransferase-like protein
MAKIPRNRMTDIPFTYRLIPPDLDVYPTIILSNETTALIGINPKKGFVLHSDGAKTELKDLKQLLIENINIPGGVYAWAKEWVEKTYKKKYVDWEKMEYNKWKEMADKDYAENYEPEEIAPTEE